MHRLPPPPSEEKQENKEVAVKNGRLVFKNRAAFEHYSTSLGKIPKDMTADAYLDAVEKKLGFLSMRREWTPLNTIPNGRTKSEAACIEDEYLASLLSPESIVQIDNYIFKIDACNKKVYALKAADEVYIAELKKETPSHPKITVFSTDDEVLNLIEAGESGNPTARTALCLRESGADGDKADVMDEYAAGPYVYRADIKHVYQKAGIYFSLLSEMKYMRRDAQGGIFWGGFSTHITLRAEFKYRRKCGSTEVFSPSPYEETVVIGDKLNRRIWESSDALHKYWLKSTYIYERKDLTGPTPVFKTISTPELRIIQDNY